MQKKITTFLAIAMIAVLGAGFVGTGCSSNKGASKEKLTIWGMGVEGEKLKDIIQLFKQDYPEADVTVQSVPWGTAHEKMITAVAGGIGPDVCQFGTTWIPEFVALDALEPLDDYIDQSSIIAKDNYFEGSWETGIIDGVNYGVPWYVDTRVLFYRTDVLKEVGFDHAPRTWTELKDACKKLTVKNDQGDYLRTGISLSAVDAKTLAMFMWSNGGAVLNDELEVVINTPENAEALNYYASFFKEGLAPMVSKGGMELYNNFKTGYTPMFIGGPWMLKDLDNYASEIRGKWDVATLPLKKTGTSFVGGSSFCIFKDSGNKELAWKFIEFMSKPDIQIEWYKLTSDLPTRLEAWEDDYFNDKKKVKVFGKQLFNTNSPPRIQKWEEIEGVINLQMEKVVHDMVTAEEALSVMEDKIKRVLDKLKK